MAKNVQISRLSRFNANLIKKKAVGSFIWILRWAFIISLSYLFVYPLLFMICTAFQDPSSVNDPSVILIPKKWSLESIKEMISVLNYVPSLILTSEISVFSTLASLVSCSLVGYGFARFNFKFKGLIFALVILTIIIPPQTILPSLLLNFQFFNFGGILGSNSINLLNTVWTFVLPSMFANGLRNGLFIFIFRQFFLGLPKDLEEAARIDGCGAIKTFVRIIVPVAVPAFITVTLFSFVWHWNDLYSSGMYFVGDVKPLMPLLENLDYMLQNSDIGSSAYAARTFKASAPLLTVLPPLILYLFTQKYFTESIERSGIVG